VVEDVLDHVARDARVVEDSADDDGVVGWVVVPEAVAGVVAAPGELGASHEAMEKAAVEVVEEVFEVVVVSAGGTDLLASSHLPHEPCFRCEIVAGNIAAVASA